MANAGSLVVNILGNSLGLQNTFQQAQGLTSGFVGRMRGLLGGLAVAAGIGFSFQSSIEGAREAAQAQNKLQAVLTATGGAAGLSAQQIAAYAGDLQQVTNYGDDATIAAAAVLATFKQIKGDVFKDALASAQDLSSVMGTDLQSSVVQVGKALNDPVKGITALSRVGVSFTEQQKEQIKTLQQSGDLLGAQGLILGELQSEFGGAAAAMADPWVQMQNIVGDVGETFGALLLPAVNEISKALIELLTPIVANGEAFAAIGAQIGQVVAFMVALPGPLKAVAIGFAIMVAASIAFAAAQRVAAATAIFLQAVLNPANLVKIGIGLALATATVYAMDQQLQSAGASAGEATEEVAALQAQTAGLGAAAAGGAEEARSALETLVASLQTWRSVDDPMRAKIELPKIDRNQQLFPEVSATTERVRELQAALVEVSQTRDMLGDAGADNFKGQIEAEIGRQTGITKAIEQTRQALAIEQRPAAEREFKLQEFRDKGATDPQLKEYDRLLVQLEQAKNLADANREAMQKWGEGVSGIQKLQDEIDLLSGAATKTEITMRELARQGFAPEQQQQLGNLTAERDRLKELEKMKERANQIVEQSRTPDQKLADEIQELQDLRDKGLLTQEQFVTAETSLKGSGNATETSALEGGGTGDSADEQRRGVGVALAGTQEAISSVLRAASGGRSPNARLEQKADVQIVAAQKTNDILSEISRNGGLGSTDLT